MKFPDWLDHHRVAEDAGRDPEAVESFFNANPSALDGIGSHEGAVEVVRNSTPHPLGDIGDLQDRAAVATSMAEGAAAAAGGGPEGA